MSRQLLALATLTLAFSGSADAQALSCQHRTIPVAFRDAQDLPIHDISPTDLEAKLRGKPVRILSLKPDARPHRVVLALDASGSMGIAEYNTRSAWLLEPLLAANFYARVRDRSQLALITFNEQVNETAEFSPNNSSFEQILQKINDRNYPKTGVRGRTAFRDAIFHALRLFVHPSSADAVLVLTDGGGDNISKHNRSALLQSLEDSLVRLFFVLIPSEQHGYRNRLPEDSDPNDLSALARSTGGEILSVVQWQGQKVILTRNSESTLTTEETLQRLYQAIVQNQLLEVALPDAVGKREHFELRLTATARKRWKNAQLTYPDVLNSCSAETAANAN